MIAANSVSSGVSCVPPPCGRTLDGGISGSAISHNPSGTIQLHVPRPIPRPTTPHHIGHGLSGDWPAVSPGRGEVVHGVDGLDGVMGASPVWRQSRRVFRLLMGRGCARRPPLRRCCALSFSWSRRRGQPGRFRGGYAVGDDCRSGRGGGWRRVPSDAGVLLPSALPHTPEVRDDHRSSASMIARTSKSIEIRHIGPGVCLMPLARRIPGERHSGGRVGRLRNAPASENVREFRRACLGRLSGGVLDVTIQQTVRFSKSSGQNPSPLWRTNR